MKFITLKTIFFVCIFLFTNIKQNSCSAQLYKDDSDEINTLLGNDLEHGGYGALYFGYTPIADRNAMSAGVKGAWIINHGLGIGFAGTGFFTDVENSIIPEEQWSALTGGHGGLLIEPILFGKQPIHISVPLIIGGGAVYYGSDKLYTNTYNSDYSGYYKSYFDYYFVFEPGIELEFNLTKFFRLAAGVSYRLTSDVNITRTSEDVEYQILNTDDLKNFSVHLAFKFGKF